MRQVILTGMALALLAGAAHAQSDPKGPKTPLDLMYEEQEQRAKQAEKEYNDTMRRTRANGPIKSSDPWRTIRPAEPTKAKR